MAGKSETTVMIGKRQVDALPVPADGEAWFWDARLKGFGVRVTANGTKTFVLRYRNTAGQGRKFTIGRHGEITPDASEMDFELGEGHFDRVEVGAVGGQEEEPGATLLEGGLGLFAPVGGEVVEDDDVAGLWGGCELSFHPEIEHFAVHLPIDDPRCGQAVAAERGDERLRSPMAERRPRHQPPVAPGPATQPGHFRRRRRLVDEDEAVRLAAHARLPAAAPFAAGFADLIAPAFRGRQRFS